MLCLRFAARYHEAPGPSAPAPTTARVPSAVWDCPFQQGTFYTCASMRKKALPACWYSKYLKCFRSDLPTRTDDTVLVWPLRVGEMGVGDPKTRDAVLSKYYSEGSRLLAIYCGNQLKIYLIYRDADLPLQFQACFRPQVPGRNLAFSI